MILYEYSILYIVYLDKYQIMQYGDNFKYNI